MISSDVYPNPFYNPELADDLTFIVTEPAGVLDVLLVTEKLHERGYEYHVTEDGDLASPLAMNGRVGARYNVPEIKFQASPLTGNIEGIDTAYGHRFTISHESNAYKLLDRKLGESAYYKTILEAKGAAVRKASDEVDQRPDAASPKYDNDRQITDHAQLFNPAPAVPVEHLRELFPEHYLTK